jgi:hypothetical protein
MSKWIVTPDKYLTEEEVKKLRKVCEEASIIAKSKGNQIAIRNRLIIEVALGTGLRVSELANSAKTESPIYFTTRPSFEMTALSMILLCSFNIL